MTIDLYDDSALAVQVSRDVRSGIASPLAADLLMAYSETISIRKDYERIIKELWGLIPPQVPSPELTAKFDALRLNRTGLLGTQPRANEPADSKEAKP